MNGQLSSGCNAFVRRAYGLFACPIRYYAKDRPINTLVCYGVIKAVVLLGAIGVSLVYQPARLFQNPTFLAGWDGGLYQHIAQEGYGFEYPRMAVFSLLFPALIKLFSLNDPALMPWVGTIIANAFSFVGLYFLYKLAPLIIDERYRLRVCFAYMVFPTLAVCSLLSYTEPLFLAFTIGAYYFWKRNRFEFAALLAILSVFTRLVGAFILIIFVVDALIEYVSRRERSRALKQFAVIGATIAGVLALSIFNYYMFSDPLAAVHVQTTQWENTVSIVNLLDNVRIYGFVGLSGIVLNYSAVPILLIDALLVVATSLFLLKRNPALSAYSFVLLIVFLSLATPMSFVRYTAAIFPLYLFLGFMLSDDWKKNMVIGVIAVVVAIQNLFVWISGAWLF